MCIAAAAIPAATLAIAAVGTAASVGMGIASANQQAATAQESMNAQAHAQQVQLQASRDQAILQQQQHRQSLILQQKQAQQAQNLQIQQANASTLNTYNQQLDIAKTQRAGIMRQNEVDRQNYQSSVETSRQQIALNNEAANRSYVADQAKITEAKKLAAFEQQTALAKSIGARGTILASGRTGQSIGLLVQDVDRQKGFAEAQSLATLDSKRDQALISMEGNWIASQSANAKAESEVGFSPTDPYMPKDPTRPAFIDGIGLSIENPYE
tara:strand:+ start:23828 stop:24634 length:807 start_codon:yes stop_codon:yes gene_type:complete